MGVVLKFNAENTANFVHKSLSCGGFFFGGDIATTTVAPVYFVDFAGGGASARNFEIARERKHGKVASFLVEANDHDGVGELSAVVGAVAFVAVHIVTTGAKGENVSATVLVGFEWLVSRLNESD